MAITTAMCTSFKAEVMQKEHDLEADTIKIALFTSAATLDASTTVYSATNEASGTGYTAGGATLTNVVVSNSGTKGIVDFDNPTWSTATITARGCLIYNASNGNKAIAVYDFEEDKSASAGDLILELPTGDATNAIIRLA